jgi:hydrogenase maturation protease
LDSADRSNPVTFLGAGNPIKSDDSVGLYMISNLRKHCGSHPREFVRIKPRSNPDTVLSKIEKGTIVIFDAVESGLSPGSIVFANISKTKYGFFATHNVPLRLVPGLASRMSTVFVLGVQPLRREIGEGLSQVVKDSADRVVDTISKMIANLRE